jgi:hypothetical protein
LLYSADGSETFLRNVDSDKANTAHIPEDGILHNRCRETSNFIREYSILGCVAMQFGKDSPTFQRIMSRKKFLRRLHVTLQEVV